MQEACPTPGALRLVRRMQRRHRLASAAHARVPSPACAQLAPPDIRGRGGIAHLSSSSMLMAILPRAGDGVAHK
jgi:hypothetical protein